MLRIILGAIVGFMVWTILLLTTDKIFEIVSPDWYGRISAELLAAIENKTSYTMDTAIMILTGTRSAILTLISGFIAALISKENFKSPFLLGIFLLAFGLFVHSIFWNYVPFWYDLLILLPLIPLAILGGRLKKN
jgi:hypothetical protein